MERFETLTDWLLRKEEEGLSFDTTVYLFVIGDIEAYWSDESGEGDWEYSAQRSDVFADLLDGAHDASQRAPLIAHWYDYAVLSEEPYWAGELQVVIGLT